MSEENLLASMNLREKQALLDSVFDFMLVCFIVRFLEITALALPIMRMKPVPAHWVTACRAGWFVLDVKRIFVSPEMAHKFSINANVADVCS